MIEFKIKEGDLTQEQAEGLVVPANPNLAFAGVGVQAFIARVAGLGPFQEAERVAEQGSNGVVPFESAWVTSPGNLKNRGVKGLIHTVAMTTDRPNEPHVVRDVIVNRGVISRSVQSAIAAANQQKFETLALPALGTGVWGLPVNEATLGTLDAVSRAGQSTLKRVTLVLWGTEAYQQALAARSKA